MTNGENKGSSREVKVLTNMSMAITKKDNDNEEGISPPPAGRHY